MATVTTKGKKKHLCTVESKCISHTAQSALMVTAQSI